VLPGASGAALVWFLATLGFGFYLTRFADYSVVYGPLGAVVATLVWLYIATVSVLLGAEFNAHLFPKPDRLLPEPILVEEQKMVTAGKSDPN
jgi:membrane protein